VFKFAPSDQRFELDASWTPFHAGEIGSIMRGNSLQLMPNRTKANVLSVSTHHPNSIQIDDREFLVEGLWGFPRRSGTHHRTVVAGRL